MPELPEVETIRRTLLPQVRGARVLHVEVRERRLRRLIGPDFESRLRGRALGEIERRGKYLLFPIGGAEYLLVHLGMSGTLELRSSAQAPRPHDHVRLRLEGERDLVFNDPRRFGLLCLGALGDLPELARIGPDPLCEAWTAERLRALFRGRRLPVKNLLMDQRTIAGIGNIYANEMLHRAAIRPRRRADRLRRRELAALAAAMRSVLSDAVRLGGSSISDFRDGNGRSGYFQLELAAYDRAGEPCRSCGSPIRRIVLAGRSSFYCPRCQR